MAVHGGDTPPAEHSARRWRFGAVILDERTLELTVAGEVMAIERKPLELLLFLLNHAGEVVTKDEILEAVWPGRILSESVLTKAVAKLREALRDETQDVIRTQHGYGYRLVAQVEVEASKASPPPRFDFKPGDHPPQRPLWNLVRRLGTGGHGEAWLARHAKTKEERVFKFALDAAALAALKREITLYRLLIESLGDRAGVVPILDWNLEEAPYFTEAEYAGGGSLVTWAESQGGLGNIPLDTRIALIAQAADKLAAAHSVGVLHKDLKPSNIFVDGSPAAETRDAAQGVRIKLADFGSGGVLDPRRLEQMGITRLGFTKTVARSDTTSGTPIYLAPEVIAGQPFTVQADIYALGVMLYQLAVGDLHRMLAPGWEKDVPDELLRDDIMASAAGNPGQRLKDAALLSQRLRTLPARRAQRAAEAAARGKAEKQQRAIERFKSRVWLIAGTTLTLTIMAAGAFTLWFDIAEEYHHSLNLLNRAARQIESGGKPAEAEAILREILHAQDERLVIYPGIIRVRSQLATLLMSQNRLAEADAQFARALADTREARLVFLFADLDALMYKYLSGSGDEVLPVSLRRYTYARISSVYGECLRRSGKHAEARRMLESVQADLDRGNWALDFEEARQKNIERLRDLYRELGLTAEEAALPSAAAP
jgi:eukaryotic-like serine/threonine-protein kinase